MNKAKLIEKVSEKAGIRSNAAKLIVDTIFDSMRESLIKGAGIEVRGFGSFVVKQYGAYKGRNPKSGKSVDWCVSFSDLTTLFTSSEVSFRSGGFPVDGFPRSSALSR